MTAPAIGKVVPDFSLPATGGTPFRLRDARGQALVLYFYPRDSTPGCTLEGQDFQRLLPAFKRAGAQVCGISRDSMASHEKFCAAHGFRFPLLVDADGEACRLFDVIHEKNMYGRKVLGIVRSTFLIDAAGKLRREWRKVKVEGHAAEVLEAVKSL
ncbi:MAG TPA: peroxiredoxin [Steroidobacteraceae bacterium]|nr:peroxiredoxin [Steroidobacteraceae bacterium]